MELPAIAAGTLLLVDAWFDITTAGTTSDLIQAVVSAAVVEIPMAMLAFWIAAHVETVCAQAARRLRGARDTVRTTAVLTEVEPPPATVEPCPPTPRRARFAERRSRRTPLSGWVDPPTSW